MNALVPVNMTNAEVYRASTDAASLCREIVLQTAMEIQGRKYVRVEGWQAIAIAHGCTGSAREVERVDGGVRAVGEIRRMSDGAVIAEAEGFVGEDEATWYGGKNKWGKEQPKRPDYAIRAMAQTRAISRACRSAFAHVVVLIDSNLSTTPAEEVPAHGFDDEPRNVTPGQKVEGRTRQSLAVTAALSGITTAEDRAELERWLDANEPGFKDMSKADLNAIQRAYNARFDALDPNPPAKTNGFDLSSDDVGAFQ